MSLEPPDDEHVPLLDPVAPPADRRLGWLARYSGATLIVPVALLCRVATLLPTTTTFYILQQFICRRYYLAHDPSRIPPDGRMPAPLCALPAIDESYAAFIALVALLDGIGGASPLAYLSQWTHTALWGSFGRIRRAQLPRSSAWAPRGLGNGARCRTGCGRRAHMLDAGCAMARGPAIRFMAHLLELLASATYRFRCKYISGGSRT
jgi:hypothetical protein